MEIGERAEGKRKGVGALASFWLSVAVQGEKSLRKEASRFPPSLW